MPGYRLTIFWDVQTDVEGHRAVFHRQRAHAVHGFVGMEHTAVGVELSGVYAVRQRGSGGRVSAGPRWRQERFLPWRPPRTCSRRWTLRTHRSPPAAGQRESGMRVGAFFMLSLPHSIHIYQAIVGGSAGGYRIRPYGVAGHHIGRRPDMPGPCRAFPKTKKPARTLTLRAEWVFLSRSGNRWRPRRGQRRAAGCRRSRPDLRSGCRRSQSSRRR